MNSDEYYDEEPELFTLENNSSKEVNVLQEHNDNLIPIISKGVRYHACRLFHDQFVPITDLEKKGIKPRKTGANDTTRGYASFCSDKSSKLGCAHAGFREANFKHGSRSVDSPTRTKVSNAIRSLEKHAPDLLSTEHAAYLLKRIETLGSKIARLDTEMYEHWRSAEIISEHTECVEELFSITEEVAGLLEQAVKEGKGMINSMDAFDEHLDPYNPDDLYG